MLSSNAELVILFSRYANWNAFVIFPGIRGFCKPGFRSCAIVWWRCADGVCETAGAGPEHPQDCGTPACRLALTSYPLFFREERHPNLPSMDLRYTSITTSCFCITCWLNQQGCSGSIWNIRKWVLKTTANGDPTLESFQLEEPSGSSSPTLALLPERKEK